MPRFLLLALLSLGVALHTGAQTATPQADPAWTLQRCVSYAVDNNLSIQQSTLSERLAKLLLRQNEFSRLPSVAGGLFYGRAFGRSINPTTNQFEDAGYNFAGLSAQADVLVFGWFSRRSSIQASRLSAQAAAADLDQMKDDVSLNVATGFLRAVLAGQQISVAQKQVDLSSAQLQQTLRFVQAGRLPEVNAAQLQSQVATDSSTLISAQANCTAAVLDLKALLNLDFETPLRPVAPDLSSMSALSFSLPESAAVYAEAARHFGAVRASQLRLEASQKSAYSARAARLPQLSVGGQLGTNYASNFQTLTGITEGMAKPSPQYFVRGADSASPIPVFERSFTPILGNIPFSEQFQNNFRNTLTVNLTLPIFNNWQSQYNLRRAVAQSEIDRIGQTTSEVTLRQNVYKAHNDARTAIQKWIAADRAATAARRAFELGQKRYDLGLSNTVEYLSIQNNQYAAESRALQAKYDLVFRLKVIDYYLGRPLTL